MLENRISSNAVESIFDYAIRFRMMADALTSILHQLRSEGGSLVINDDKTVPWIECANKKKSVVWNAFLRTRGSRSRM